MQRITSAIAAGSLALFSAATAVAQSVPAGCPTEVVPLTNWYVTQPDMDQVTEVTLYLTFNNSSGFDVTFSATAADTIQIWSIPNVIDPALTFISWPTSANNGENYSYEVTIDVSSLPDTETGFGIRPRSIELGTMGPNDSRSTLVSAEIGCVAAPPPPPPINPEPIPTLSRWSGWLMIVLIAAFGWFVLGRMQANRASHRNR